MYNLSEYKITLPVNALYNLDGEALELQGLSLANLNNYWFRENETRYIFRCPDGGATTPNAGAARTELRHMTDYPVTQASSQSINVSIDQTNPAKLLTIFQIHGGNSPWVKIIYSNNMIRAFVKTVDGGTDTKVTMKTGVTLGQIVNIGLSYDGAGKLTVTVDDAQQSFQMSRVGSYFYKRGCYPNDVSFTGAVYQVSHYED